MPKKDILIAGYSRYVNVLEKNKTCIEYMPFRWVPSQDSYNIIEDGGMKKFLFLETSREHANDLANIVNELISVERQLRTWIFVIEEFPDKDDKHSILFEFILPLAERSLLLPYTIQARFYFSMAQISHQANLMTNRTSTDNLSTLPLDQAISQEIASSVAKSWKYKRKLLSAIEKINSREFQENTRSFRNIYTHRHWPGIEIGSSKSTYRSPNSNNASYLIGAPSPLKLSDIVPEVERQCEASKKAYSMLQKLVREQIAAAGIAA